MPGLPDMAPLLKDDMRAYLYVAVTDTGPGLTPKELDMLFQRFSQVSRESNECIRWSGLTVSKDTYYLWRFWIGFVRLSK